MDYDNFFVSSLKQLTVSGIFFSLHQVSPGKLDYLNPDDERIKRLCKVNRWEKRRILIRCS